MDKLFLFGVAACIIIVVVGIAVLVFGQ